VVAEDRRLGTVNARVEQLLQRARRINEKNPRAIRIIAAVAVAIYAVAMLWPYFAATLVRGSAVTAWNNVATAPIRGRVPAKLPFPGMEVGADGAILEIANDLLDPGGVKVAEANLAGAQARLAAAKAYLDGVQEIDNDRRALRRLHAANYRADLDAEIGVMLTKVALRKTKVAAATQVAERTKSVSDSGYRSKDYRDEAAIRLAETEADLAAERMELERLQRRRAAAEQGIFLAPDGSSLNWAYDAQQDAKIEIKRARLGLEQAQAVGDEAVHALDAAREAFRLQSKAPVRAPPGATIRSIVVGADAAVEAGGAVATWIDCRELYVDAPVSDAALPLIPVGSEAEVIIEGEGRWRKAHVTNIRGAAETIGSTDIAAVAKGRGRGDGQVLLRLDAKPEEFHACPVGQAAYVHFPTAGVIAVLLARIGLR
jgi:multidrug resistance efflux pump